MFTMCYYVSIPSELNVVELLEAGSEDSYVFSAPETIE